MSVLRKLSKLLVQLRLQLEGAIIQSSLQNTGEKTAGGIRDVDTEVMLELRVVQSERLDVLSLEEGAVLQKESKENKAECKAKQD